MGKDISRHMVFISYYHKDDQDYKDELLSQNKLYDLFLDCSVHEDEIDDSGLSDEDIRRIIRDNYIRQATVLILLCGRNSKTRKHLDWELHAAMFDTENNPKMGVLVVNLPTIHQGCRATSDVEKELVKPGSVSWVVANSRAQLEDLFPYMPSRVLDNYEASLVDNGVIPVTTVDWARIDNNPDVLKELVDIAFDRGRSDGHYKNSAPMRDRNSTGMVSK